MSEKFPIKGKYWSTSMGAPVQRQSPMFWYTSPGGGAALPSGVAA